MPRKFLPQSTINARMDRKDARFHTAARQLGLQAEVLPYASVEIIRAPAPVRICAWCPDFDRTVRPAPGASYGICARCSATFDREAAEAAAFRAFLADPGTAARLDAMLAEDVRIDAEQLEADAAARELEDSDADEALGSMCGVNCGFCGRCS